MNVEIMSASPVSRDDVADFESKLGQSLPDEVREFFLKYNGAQLKSNIFKVNERNSSGVEGFIPLGEVLEERKYLEDISAQAFPIAWAEGGNYVFIDPAVGCAVYFWDHEEPQKVCLLSNGINGFISMLEKFDPDSIELAEGQVESARIDPDFLKSLKQ